MDEKTTEDEVIDEAQLHDSLASGEGPIEPAPHTDAVETPEPSTEMR